MNFYETKNKHCDVILVASLYNATITQKMLNKYYSAPVDDLKVSKMTPHDFNLYTSYKEVYSKIPGHLAIYEESNEGVSSGRQPAIKKLI